MVSFKKMKSFILFLAFAVCVFAVPTTERRQYKFLNDHVKKSMQRVTGGSTAKVGDIPWQGTVIIKARETLCGGATLISDQWVIMHGYCADYLAEELEIELGGITMYVEEEGRLAFQVAKIHPHKKTRILLALVKLETTVPDDNYRIKKINLPNAEEKLEIGNSLRVSGYASSPNHKLQYDDFTVISNEDCAKVWGDDKIKEDIVCTAGVKDGGHCYIDIGGPAVLNHKDGPVLGGIVTWFHGLQCGDGKHSPYFRAEALLSWIEEVTTGITNY